MAKANPFSVVFDQPSENPFAEIAPTRLPQSVIPEKVDNPFAALFDAPNPAAPRAVRQAPPLASGAAYSAGGGDPLVSTLQKAGFKGEALKTAWAIAKRESGGRPEAYNGDRGTGDQSYGLFQINMLGKMGPSRRQQFGIKSNEALLDPLVNARAAFKMSHGGTDFGAWGIGRNAYRKMPALDTSGFPGASTLPYRGQQPSYRTLPYRGELAHVDNLVQSNNVGAQAVRQAATQLGKPYVFGSGPDTSSFDCSDLVQWSYRQLGVNIPRDTVGQQAALPLKSWKDLRPGDPIYRKSGGHVVIYAGNGKVIAAPHTGTVVQYQPLSNFPQDAWEVRSAT